MSSEDIDSLTRRQIIDIYIDKKNNKVHFETNYSIHNWTKLTLERAILSLLSNPSASATKESNLELLVTAYKRLQ